jgi:transcriptional regulator of acetoin/glycerol metabolism
LFNAVGSKSVGTSMAMCSSTITRRQGALCEGIVTGKELVARAIHNLSLRNDRAIIKINCATLPSHLIESELFGHEKGAFTSAHARQLGRFEVANGATLFLDEIGELPMDWHNYFLPRPLIISHKKPKNWVIYDRWSYMTLFVHDPATPRPVYTQTGSS